MRRMCVEVQKSRGKGAPQASDPNCIESKQSQHWDHAKAGDDVRCSLRLRTQRVYSI